MSWHPHIHTAPLLLYLVCKCLPVLWSYPKKDPAAGEQQVTRGNGTEFSRGWNCSYGMLFHRRPARTKPCTEMKGAVIWTNSHLYWRKLFASVCSRKSSAVLYAPFIFITSWILICTSLNSLVLGIHKDIFYELKAPRSSYILMRYSENAYEMHSFFFLNAYSQLEFSNNFSDHLS